MWTCRLGLSLSISDDKGVFLSVERFTLNLVKHRNILLIFTGQAYVLLYTCSRAFQNKIITLISEGILSKGLKPKLKN